MHELRQHERVQLKPVQAGAGCPRPPIGSSTEHGFLNAVDLHIAMCNNLHMATNLALDDKLIEEARKAGHHRTKKDAVTAALAEYVKRHKQQRILEAFGSFEFDPAYDYKQERRRSR
jgi:Arc/MetJ family transcription regulator